MVFRTGFLHVAVSVLGRLHFLQVAASQFASGALHPGHLLVDWSLRVWLDTVVHLALTAIETGEKQMSEGRINTLLISCAKITVSHFLLRITWRSLLIPTVIHFCYLTKKTIVIIIELYNKSFSIHMFKCVKVSSPSLLNFKTNSVTTDSNRLWN